MHLCLHPNNLGTLETNIIASRYATKEGLPIHTHQLVPHLAACWSLGYLTNAKENVKLTPWTLDFKKGDAPLLLDALQLSPWP